MEHVLHVSSASRAVARKLRLNEDLCEAIGLSHDIGHSPFGHHGEEVLSRLAKKHGIGKSFEHEVNGLRVVDLLAELDRETQPGLDLTFEVRDGIISHNGEEFVREIVPQKTSKNLNNINSKKEVGTPCTLEGCIVRMVDKIAYAGRDIEDALIAGIIREKDIPQEITKTLGSNNGEITGNLLDDLVKFCKKNPDRVGLSKEKYEAHVDLIKFNYERIYKSEEVEKFKKQATRAIEELFNRLLEDLNNTNRLRDSMDQLPMADLYEIFSKFINKIGYLEENPNSLIVLDFIAGMTDNYVVNCLNEIFVPKGII
jgi:dGTPase